MPAQQYSDKNVLLRQEVWATLTYPDGSQFSFKTTLNGDILREKDIILEEGKFPRLDKQYYMNGRYVYRQFSFVGVTVTLWDTEHYDDPDSYKVREFL